MKKLLTLALLSVSLHLSAQTATTKIEAEKTQSKAEIFSERSGTLVQKQFVDIGMLKSGKIQVALFTDLISGQKTSAVRFEKEYASTYSSDTKVALLDPDELDALIKSLNLLKDKVYNTTPTDYTEVNFRSRSGFSAGCYFSKNKWSAFIKLERFDANSYVWFDIDQTQNLIDLLTKAKARLIT